MEHIREVSEIHRMFLGLKKHFCPFRSASDVAMATKQLRNVLEKGKNSLAEVGCKVLHAKQSSRNEYFGKLGCIITNTGRS